MISEFGITDQGRSECEVIRREAQGLEQWVIVIYGLIEVTCPARTETDTIGIEMQMTDGQRAILGAERPGLVSMGHDDMGGAPTDAVISFIPGSNDPWEFHCFRFLGSALDNLSDSLNNQFT